MPDKSSESIADNDLKKDAGSVGEKNDTARTGDIDTVRNEARDRNALVFGILFYLCIGILIAWNSDSVQVFLIDNLLPIGIIVALGGGFYIYTRKDNQNLKSQKRKINFVIFGALPILIALAVAIYIMPQHHSLMLRSFFLLIVCFLPATLYFLFIASSKTSLLHEYFTNLSKLGLFERQGHNNAGNNQESELGRRVRVMSYLEKFEAVYGSIPKELKDEIITATDPDKPGVRVPDFDKYTADKMLGGIFTPATTVPVVIATLLIGLGWLLTLPPWELLGSESGTLADQDSMSAVLQPETTPVNFAFLGAYFFSLQMLFRRYIRKDLRGNAYTAASLRIILAVVGIWAVLQAAPFLNLETSGSVLLVVAFVIGAFPPVVWQIIQSAFRIATGARYFVPSLRSEIPVSELDGLTVWHESRLEEEDIENVPNMATANLVELLLHTRIPPERIIDWVDQAILYTQLGPDKTRKKEKKEIKEKKEEKIKEGMEDSSSDYASYAANRITRGLDSLRMQFRERGIRTASDFIVAYTQPMLNDETISSPNNPASDRQKTTQNLVKILKTYPNLKLIMRWRSLQTDFVNISRGPELVTNPLKFHAGGEVTGDG